MKKIILSLFLLFGLFVSLNAQIINGLDTLYGNEWIDYDLEYFKVMVSEDGIYELSSQALTDAGVPLSQIDGAEFRLFHNGEEVPIYTTTNGSFGANDRIEFFGKKNTSELDQYLFENPDEEMMNPRYSLFTDTSAYFLTWSSTGTPLRYEEISNDLTNLPQKEEYYWAEETVNLFSHYQKEGDSEGVRLSSFTMGEGFASNLFEVQTHTLNPSMPYIGGPDGDLYLRYSGRYGTHEVEIILNGDVLTTDVFSNFQVREGSFSVANSDLDNSLELSFESNPSTDRNRVSNIALSYPREFNAVGNNAFSFEMEPVTGNKKYIEIVDFNFSGGQSILYDIKNGQRLVAAEDSGIIKFSLPSIGEERVLWLINSNTGVKSIENISAVEFIDYGNLNADFVFLSNSNFINDGGGNNYIQEYAEYRASMNGGNYTPIIVDVQQVYDQFGWGLNRHSLSIRNFGHYIKREWPDVKYFFIVGKGREYIRIRKGTQLATASNETFFVPTFGVPGSDNLLLAGNDKFTPIIPVGRIAATSKNDIRIYLEKVKEHEGTQNLPQTIADREWMKRNLHLGGGNGSILSEQQLIRNNLEGLAEIAKNGRVGASTRGYYKTSTDPIQQSQTEEIFNYINNGTSMITFFGHSSVGVFDFSIDFPDNWQNKGKYPWILSLGCYSGNIHTNTIGIGERFLFLEDAGSIAFSATAGQGYISSLNTTTTKIYEELGGDSYGKSIGEVLQKMVGSFQGNDFGVNLIRHQFNLLGDPSININTAPGPDYLVDATSVKFSPSQVNVSQEQFNMSFDVVNIGENRTDSILVNIEQQLPDASRIIVGDTLIPAPANRIGFSINIPVSGKNGIGLNRLYVKIDESERVDELPLPVAELNNELVMSNGELGATLFIRDNSAMPVFPPDFSMTGPDVTLKAYTTDPLAPSRKYLLQIDTTEQFNSPFLQSTEITQPGGILRWQPNVLWQDETVYYWQVTPDSLSPFESFNWNQSSFLYKNDGTEGWNQSHYYQFLKDEMINMVLDGHNGWKFLEDLKDFSMQNSPGNISVTLNNAFRGQFWGGSATANVYWVDSIYIEPKENTHPATYGMSHPWSISTSTFFFDLASPEGRKDLMDFLNDVVGPEDYVLLLTALKSNGSTDFNPEEWAADSLIYGENLFQVLEQRAGANRIREMETLGSVPYVLGFQNNGNLLGEKIALNYSDTLELLFSLEGNWDRGQVKTPLIGPASQWNTMYWESESASLPDADTVAVEIYGVDDSGGESLVISQMIDNEIDLSSINSEEYPFLKLKLLSKDSLFRTTAKLNYWRITYKGVPEFAYDSSVAFNFEKDTVQAGEPLKLKYNVANLSLHDGDSLLVKYAVTNEANEQELISQTLPVIIADESKQAELTIDTRTYNGRNSLLIELNPDNDQPEQTHINNFLQTDFYVEGDIRNPLLDVTFDGIQILDGEIVSPKPNIHITLKDENPYLLLDDTSSFKLFILYPDSIQPTPIYMNSLGVHFTPANSSNENRASVEFSPVFESDGDYVLIVQARDMSGNISGAFDFKRTFKVITKTSISNFINYPNPFSTATRFLYTLTGSEVPATYKLQIMTVSGRIIREVNRQELGDLKAGTHLTDFVWDGRDEFGDQLANGVYLYRLVVLDNNGEEWDKFETGADAYFKEGFGKMVLIR